MADYAKNRQKTFWDHFIYRFHDFMFIGTKTVLEN